MQESIADVALPELSPVGAAAANAVDDDLEVRLLDGRCLRGRLHGKFRPQRDLQLRLADGSELALQPAGVRLAIHRQARSSAGSAVAPRFELHLTDGSLFAGQLRALHAQALGALLHVRTEGREQSIYAAYALIDGLSIGPSQAAGPDPIGPASGGDRAPRDTAHGASRPGEVIVLSAPAELQRYLEMIQGKRSRNFDGNAVSLELLRAANEPEIALYELAARLGLPVVELEKFPLPLPTSDALPVPMLRRLGVIPLLATRDLLAVATSNPADQELTTALGFLTPHRLVPMLASQKAIHLAFGRTYDRVEDEELVRSLGLDVAGRGGAEVVEREAERLAREKPVVGLVADIVGEAIHRRASDIHIRPGAQDVELLYRIDGELVPVRRFLRALLPALVSRIKVMGNMNIAEHRVPQDGRVSVSEGGQSIDMRISMLPTVHGEAVVMRLLNTREGLRKLEEIGFSAVDERRFRDLLLRGHGMILVTGPTGCGKSTTLYSALLEVRKQNVNIVTVEDPVEYRIPETEQIQVNRIAGTTFAATLRNILRHDPDVIMIGEIRDGETAEIAVESALTGHLVLSTLHTNSAATSVTRLLDLGVEPFLLRSTLLAALAQRLARRNCPDCSTAERGDPHMREVLGCLDDEQFQIGGGCAACDGTGVRGRVAVYELLPIDPTVRRLIQPRADADAIHALAVHNGMRPITDHALALARAGTISLAEAFRIRVE